MQFLTPNIGRLSWRRGALPICGLLGLLALGACSDNQSSSNQSTKYVASAADQKACADDQRSKVLTPPFQKMADYPGSDGYTINLTSLESVSDDSSHPTGSTLVLCEDGKPLGPAHSGHAEISSTGMGRYSHWGAYLRFSTSDNSDPNTNNRKYTVGDLE